MRLCWKVLITALVLSAPAAGLAASCTAQGELSAQDRNALAAAGERVAVAILQQDDGTLQSSLFSGVAQDWPGIRGAVEDGAPLVKGGQAQIQSLYLLDASAATAVADTQFFCSNASGSLTVTITMHALPPGKYAVVLADAAGAPLGGKLGIILVWDPTAASAGWKLGGISIRQGIIDGHDGVWFWTKARALAATNAPWSAWSTYETARYLLLPVDFISSPNMDKLVQEQSLIKDSPSSVFPYSVIEGARTWKIDSIRVETSLHEDDLGVTYESLGITDPTAARTEAVAVLSALLKAHPELRENFHGLWALASRDGKVTPVIELPMAQIP
ncbi:MAG: hypothetical protein WCA11_11765 [Terracidiphilus sp.]